MDGQIDSNNNQSGRSQHQEYFKDTALGLVSTKSFPAIVGTADMMLKSAGVILVGYEKIGSGHCTATSATAPRIIAVHKPAPIFS